MKENENMHLCPHCGHELVRETELDYPWVCKECDENFYEFETIVR